MVSLIERIERIERIEQIERDIAPIEVAVSNMGANVRFSITETTARVYQMVWEMACFSGVLMGREVTKVMPPRSRGTIIFIGATASLRGREGFAAFAGAKQCPASAHAEHVPRAAVERHPRCAPHHQRRYRYRLYPHQLSRSICDEGSGRHSQSRPHRGSLRAGTSPTA